MKTKSNFPRWLLVALSLLAAGFIQAFNLTAASNLGSAPVAIPPIPVTEVVETAVTAVPATSTSTITATTTITASTTITATGTTTGTTTVVPTSTPCIIVATSTPTAATTASATGTITGTATITSTATITATGSPTVSATSTSLVTRTAVVTAVATEIAAREGAGRSGNVDAIATAVTEVVTTTATLTGTITATGTVTGTVTASTTVSTSTTPGSATPSATAGCQIVTPTPCPSCASPTPCVQEAGNCGSATSTPSPTHTPTPTPTPTRIPFRYLTINVGNFAAGRCRGYENKLCDPAVSTNIRNYIATWQPDVIMLSEAYNQAQLKTTVWEGSENLGGPILPAGYDGICGKSVDRFTGAVVGYLEANASHQHECVAWKTSRVSMVAGSALSEYGRNDAWGQAGDRCHYDFTGFAVTIRLINRVDIRAVAVHPQSGVGADNVGCRTWEISRYWSNLATGSRVVIGGDWNTESATELAVPAPFGNPPNYSFGQHWNIATHSNEYTAFYYFGNKKYDHDFSNFGIPSTAVLPFGSAVGDYDGHPRADGGGGMDHRQILVDMLVLP